MPAKALTIGLLIAITAVSACNRSGSGASRPLLNIRSAGIPPDEFLVTPRRPLERPDNVFALPQPAPGTMNRAELDPDAPMLEALGARRPRGDIPVPESALVAAVRSAAGPVPADIRSILATEDAALREQRAEEAGSIYEFMVLDPFAEAARLRALGINSPEPAT